MTFSSVNQPLPSSAELLSSDDTPVDNEDQNLLPNLLLLPLTHLWANRMDWYFGVDMAVYHTTGLNPRVPVVPNAFLSLGVERKKEGKSRRSYVLWKEQSTPPIMVLEMVSHQLGDEYEGKMTLYAWLGVLYYVIYNQFIIQSFGSAIAITPLKSTNSKREPTVYRLVNPTGCRRSDWASVAIKPR
jgi:Uma2 family endonuclease